MDRFNPQGVAILDQTGQVVGKLTNITTAPNTSQAYGDITKPKGLTEGRIVHYVMPDGTVRPAMVVRVWSKDSGCANLQVFLDGGNDHGVFGGAPYEYSNNTPNMAWRTSVVYDAVNHAPYTWHYPAYVE